MYTGCPACCYFTKNSHGEEIAVMRIEMGFTKIFKVEEAMIGLFPVGTAITVLFNYIRRRVSLVHVRELANKSGLKSGLEIQ